MSLPLTSWLIQALKDEGLTVIEVDGWQTRGRPYTFDPHGAVMFHHTASSSSGGNAPALGTVTYGRSDLPGPLCNMLVARNGTVYVVAAGYANHAGLGGPFKDIPEDSGNKYIVGVEVENNGIGEPWSDNLLNACYHVFAAVLKHYGKDSSWLLGHKEWAPTRKIDPHPIDMDAARAATAAIMSAPIPEPEPEDDVPLTGQMEDALAYLWGYQRRVKLGATDNTGKSTRPAAKDFMSVDGKTDRSASAQAGWDKADSEAA